MCLTITSLPKESPKLDWAYPKYIYENRNTHTRHTKANANCRVCASHNAVGYALAMKKLTEWCELSSKHSTMSGYVHYAHIRAQHGIHIYICASRWLPHTSNVMNTYQPASHPQPSAAKHCDCIELDRCPRTVPTEHVYCIYEKYRLMYMNCRFRTKNVRCEWYSLYIYT